MSWNDKRRYRHAHAEGTWAGYRAEVRRWRQRRDIPDADAIAEQLTNDATVTVAIDPDAPARWGAEAPARWVLARIH